MAEEPEEEIERIWGDGFVIVRRRLKKGAFGGEVDDLEEDLWDEYGRREAAAHARYGQPLGVIDLSSSNEYTGGLSVGEFISSFFKSTKGSVTVEWVLMFSGTMVLLTVLLGILYPPLVTVAQAQQAANLEALRVLNEINATGCMGLLP